MLARFVLLALVLAGCGPRASTVLRNEAPTHAAPVQSPPEVTTINELQWRVAVTCEYAGARRTAAALVFLTPPTASVPAPFANVAAADAWLLVGKDLMKGDHYADAIVAARQGLDRLGADYRAPTVRDDTPAEIAKGEALIETDGFGAAAKLVTALEARIYMATVREDGRVLRDVPLDE